MGTLSPLLVKSLRKLERLVRKEMEDISALEIILPSMTHSKLLEKSGRIDLPDLFKLKDTNEKSYILNPTCEEAITDLIASMNAVNYKQLPLRFYQISNKFRNEKRSKSGLIRSKEFLMKDLYCFDATLFESEKSYEEVKNKYHDFFQLLNVPYICVKGLPGTIGGLHSHEFHFLSDAGDDELSICQECGHHVNIDYCKTFEESCPNCHSKNINISKGIEVVLLHPKFMCRKTKIYLPLKFLLGWPHFSVRH